MLNKKYVLSAILLMLILVLAFPLIANASDEDEEEPGSLTINTQVITDTQMEITVQRSIGFELMPFLFLEDEREMERRHIVYQAHRLDEARNMAFIVPSVEARLDTSEVISSLFIDLEDRVTTHVGQVSTGYQLVFEMPTWLWVIIGIGSAGLLGCVGIVIGRKVSHLIHREKEAEIDV